MEEEAISLKILFIINPISGGSDKSTFLETIQKNAELQVFDYTIHETTGKDDKKKIVDAINTYKPNIVTAVGGDGTCNLVASILIDFPQIALGIIPFGSANGLATELGIPANKEQAIILLTTGIKKAIDVVVVNKVHISLHISDLGLNARIVKRFEEENVRGMAGYIKQFFRELRASVPSRFDIITNNTRIRRKAHMVAFANSAKYGTGAILNPSGKMDDGKFELCIIKPFPYYAMLAILARFFLGNIHRSSYVDIISCQEAIITSKKNLMLQVDGEYIGKTRRVELQIKANALTIIVPAIE